MQLLWQYTYYKMACFGTKQLLHCLNLDKVNKVNVNKVFLIELFWKHVKMWLVMHLLLISPIFQQRWQNIVRFSHSSVFGIYIYIFLWDRFGFLYRKIKTLFAKQAWKSQCRLKRINTAFSYQWIIYIYIITLKHNSKLNDYQVHKATPLDLLWNLLGA